MWTEINRVGAVTHQEEGRVGKPPPTEHCMGRFRFVSTPAHSNKQKEVVHLAASKEAASLFGTGCCSCCKFLMGSKCTYTSPWKSLTAEHDSTQRHRLRLRQSQSCTVLEAAASTGEVLNTRALFPSSTLSICW